jgi:hypothetical protein
VQWSVSEYGLDTHACACSGNAAARGRPAVARFALRFVQVPPCAAAEREVVRSA